MRQTLLYAVIVFIASCIAGCEVGCDHGVSFEQSHGEDALPDAGAPEIEPETTAPVPSVVPPPSDNAPALDRPSPFGLPEGFQVETAENAFVVVVPERSTFGALYRDEQTGRVAFLFMNGPQSRTVSGIYVAVPFPDQLEVTVTELVSGGSEVLVNLPAGLMADFVVTLMRILEPSSAD